jgi:hypothetical protein
MSYCSSCGAEIEWVKTEYGKNQPLDPEPSLLGNVEVRDDVAYYVRDAEREGRMLRISHFASCPNAKRHRAT